MFLKELPLGKILSDKPISVFISSTFPGMVWFSKEESFEIASCLANSLPLPAFYADEQQR
jgi:hypothetical protein